LEGAVRSFVIAWAVLAIVIAIVAQQTSGYALAQLPGLFAAMPGVHQGMIVLSVGLLLWLLGSAVWQADRLAAQNKAITQLRQRLDGARDAIVTAEGEHRELDSAIRAVANTDPEEAIASLQKRLAETERGANLQQSRSQTPDLQERIEDIHNRQKAVRLQLGGIVEKRRASEPLLREVRERQTLIEKALADIEVGDKGASLGGRVSEITEQAATAQARLTAAQDALVTLNRLNQTLDGYQADLAPLENAEIGIEAALGRVQVLREVLDRKLGALEVSENGRLADRIETLLAGKREVEQRMAGLDDGLATIRSVGADYIALKDRQVQLDRTLAEAEADDSGSPLEQRLDQVSQFTKQARSRLAHLQDLQFQLRAVHEDLAKSQADLAPLQSSEQGVESVVADIEQMRRQLTGTLDKLESDGEKTLVARLDAFVGSKHAAELRIAELQKTLAQLEAMRTDIGALFTSLTTSLNGHAGPGAD
jgi:chromosome segregation ATPase